MSNESENRIDLTQFEGRTEGSWLERTGGNMARWIVRGQFLENDANEALICAAPDLLAELKRCYEELDKWTNYATYIENVDMDCHQDASAEAGFLWKCTDCGAHFELPENGIYECEFGCDASE